MDHGRKPLIGKQYRRTQRQLGEIQVAMRLLSDLLNQEPGLEPALRNALNHAGIAKARLFTKARELEASLGMEIDE